MGRTVKKDKLPHPKPVIKVQLNEKYNKLRVIAVILLLAVAAIAFIYAMLNLLNKEVGFREIEADTETEGLIAGEFVFQYYLGADGVNATVEYRELTRLYTETMKEAARIFASTESFEGMNNLYSLSLHPNEILKVDEALYEALSLMEQYGRREIFLAPVYEQYRNLFASSEKTEAAGFDPFVNEELASWYQELCAFIQDEQMIRLELLGDNQVRLFVSEEYLQYARDNQMTAFMDFFWMRNAFVVDYAAEILQETGYTRGSISSYDGFIRNLDESGHSYSLNLYDRNENTVTGAARMEYAGPLSIVSLRNFGMNSLDMLHYFEYEGGEIRTPYIDIADGFCKSSVNNLLAYAENKGCAEILMQVLPVYIADSFQAKELELLTEQGIYAVYGMDGVLYYNEEDIMLKDVYEKDGRLYAIRYTEF